MIEIIVNGKKEQVSLMTIYTYLMNNNLDVDVETTSIVILINDKIIKSSTWKDIYLKENDKIEILNFVSGG